MREMVGVLFYLGWGREREWLSSTCGQSEFGDFGQSCDSHMTQDTCWLHKLPPNRVCSNSYRHVCSKSLSINYFQRYRFLVLSFVFKASQKIASFTLGLKSFVKIWEGERLQSQRSMALYDSFSNKHETQHNPIKIDIFKIIDILENVELCFL